MKTFFLAALMALTANTVQAATRTIEMTVDGLVCAFCAQGINKRLRQLEPTADVYVSLEQHLVALSLKEGQDIRDEILRQTLTEAGYTVRAITRSDASLEQLRARGGQP